MLVLSRKQNQEVCLPGLDVNIKVLQIKGNTVRLGIDAPDDIHVLRGELNEFRQSLPAEITVPINSGLAYAGQTA